MKLVAQTLAQIGRPVQNMARGAWELYELAFETFTALFTFRFSREQFIKQCYEIGNRSVLFISVTLGVLGCISVFQVGHQIEKVLPDFTMMGAAFLQIVIREFGPTIAGLMLATRVGSGIAAEIGSMVVTEQVDALRMSNADPVRFLVAPRTLASAIMSILLSVYGVAIATLTGMLVAKSAYGVHYQTFLNPSLLAVDDVIVGLVKALSYGLAIPIIASYEGLRTQGGSAGVGWATTRAVVHTSFAVIILDFLISAIGYLAVS